MHAQVFHHVVGGQENTATVDTTEKADADRLRCRKALKPYRDLIRHSADVTLTDAAHIGSHGRPLGRKKSSVDWIGIGTSNQLDFDDMMRRNHPGVAGMNLRSQAFAFEPSI